MFIKMVTLLTAMPLALALCGEATAAFGLSDAAKDRQQLCKNVKKLSKTDPRYVLNEFCDKITGSFHCADSKRAGIFKIKGACDDARLCSNKEIQQACKEQCLDLRTDKFGKKDDKSIKIEALLNKCPIKSEMGKNLPPLPILKTENTPQLKRETLPPLPVLGTKSTENTPQLRRETLPPLPVLGTKGDEMEVTVPKNDMPPATFQEFDSMPDNQDMAPPPPPPPPLMNSNGQIVSQRGLSKSIQQNRALDDSQEQARQDMQKAQGPNTRGNLLGDIEKGYQLRKVGSPEGRVQKQLPPSVEDPRGNLLDAIRKGRQLNNTQDRVLREPPKVQDNSMGAIIARNMEERRKAIEGDDDHRDESGTDNWE